jgi:hypothetical protein
MPIGFEFGFRRALHVVSTRPEDWETTSVDLREFIGAANRLKTDIALFSQESSMLLLPSSNPAVLIMWQGSATLGQEALLFFNTDVWHDQHVEVSDLRAFVQSGQPLVDVSPEFRMDFVAVRPSSISCDPGKASSWSHAPHAPHSDPFVHTLVTSRFSTRQQEGSRPSPLTSIHRHLLGFMIGSPAARAHPSRQRVTCSSRDDSCPRAGMSQRGRRRYRQRAARGRAHAVRRGPRGSARSSSKARVGVVHPALIDVMRERWAAIPEFQRTRGALRFLAACLRASHRSGRSRPLLGPGDVPLNDPEVRLAFFKEVGQREEFQPCLEHDFVGANSRTRRIDERRAREVTAEAGKQPARRLATAILMYSFGGLRRAEAGEGDLLPPGISEQELLTVCVAPDLDSTTAQACIKELREQCLYLHFDGARYRFKQDPNVTLMVEQESEVIERDLGRVESKIKELFEERMAGERTAIIWQDSSGIPDGDPHFLVAYLPLSFGGLSDDAKRTLAIRLLETQGDRKRNFLNGVGLAVPSSDQIDALRRSVRYLLAVERVQTRSRELNLTDPQKEQLRERGATERAAVESSLLRLYAEAWLPSVTNGDLTLDRVAIGGRPLQNTLDEKKRALVHQRIIELLTLVQPKVFTSLAPGKIPELFKLGTADGQARGIATDEVVRAFYSFLASSALLGLFHSF